MHASERSQDLALLQSAVAGDALARIGAGASGLPFPCLWQRCPALNSKMTAWWLVGLAFGSGSESKLSQRVEDFAGDLNAVKRSEVALAAARAL